jgi:hypothetical protein
MMNDECRAGARRSRKEMSAVTARRYNCKHALFMAMHIFVLLVPFVVEKI